MIKIEKFFFMRQASFQENIMSHLIMMSTSPKPYQLFFVDDYLNLSFGEVNC